MRLFYRIYCRLLRHFNTVKYAKKIGVNLGKNVLIAESVSFDSEPYLIEIGDGTKISNNVRFVTHDGGAYVLRKIYDQDADLFGKIRIGTNCFIGNNVSIMPNVTIGDSVIIGYGSIVTKDIPSNEVWAGVPARYIKTIDEYYEKNKNDIVRTKGLNPMQKRKFLEEYYKQD